MQIERETVIAAPVERVWALLTEAEHVGRWFGDAGAEIDLRPGGAMVMRWTEHGTAHGRVVDVDPPRRFSYDWVPFKGLPGTEPAEANSTRVEFTLDAEGDGTRLRVVESGFETLDCSDEERAGYLEGNVEGWTIELGHLSEHAARVTV
jgi:uncharacterized protein YndB with AHSA1/START domain